MIKNQKSILLAASGIQNGQILNGTITYSDDIDNFWLQKAFANLGLKIGISKWFSITAALEANLRFPFNKKNTSLESRLYSFDYYIDQLRADNSFPKPIHQTPIYARLFPLQL